jgi:hypothetical protein
MWQQPYHRRWLHLAGLAYRCPGEESRYDKSFIQPASTRFRREVRRFINEF